MSSSSPVIDAGGGIVLLGGGGHATGVVNVIHLHGRASEIAGYLDDQADSPRMSRWGLLYLGPLYRARIADAKIALAVGTPKTAHSIIESLSLSKCVPLTLIHPDSSVAFDVELEPGCLIFAGSRLLPHVRASSYSYFGQNTSIGHDTTVGNTSSIMAGATIGGDCNIGDRVMVGISATVLPGLRIGDDARIGAGAVVTKDVEAGQTVVGIPARPILDQAGDN